MAFKVSEKEHNESLCAAVRAAAYLKETDERFKGTNPIVPFSAACCRKAAIPISTSCAPTRTAKQCTRLSSPSLLPNN